jgi:hypothetical protein
MKRAILLLVLTACGALKPREVVKFPPSAHQPELERLLPEMKAGFPEEHGKALKVALVDPYGHPYVDGGKTHRRLYVWVGVQRSLVTGTQCFVEMHDYDQTKTDDGWTPPKWLGRSPHEQENDQDGIIACPSIGGGN